MADLDQFKARAAREQVLVDVARAMTAIYREQFGRGPAGSRAYWAGEDTIVALLSETLTPAERNLVRMGEHQRLRDVRLFFQYASEDQFRSVVEQASGRRVLAFISGIDSKQDVSAELFVLQPASGARTL